MLSPGPYQAMQLSYIISVRFLVQKAKKGSSDSDFLIDTKPWRNKNELFQVSLPKSQRSRQKCGDLLVTSSSAITEVHRKASEVFEIWTTAKTWKITFISWRVFFLIRIMKRSVPSRKSLCSSEVRVSTADGKLLLYTVLMKQLH